MISTPAEDELDRAIRSASSTEWQKTAMIVARTIAALEARHVQKAPEAVAIHVAALIQRGDLELRGDVADWRHSEVRRPESFND